LERKLGSGANQKRLFKAFREIGSLIEGSGRTKNRQLVAWRGGGKGRRSSNKKIRGREDKPKKKKKGVKKKRAIEG